MRLAFDMETKDPDDALTLCLLATHPAVELAAVTINPGTPDQVGVAREILRRAGAGGIRIGARDATRSGEVSPFHYEWLGDVAPADPDDEAHELLARTLVGDAVLLCGAPLHNVRALLREHATAVVERWVVQGGYAPPELVPPHARLEKFAGRAMVESHNFGANRRATLAILAEPRVKLRQIVSKNVTHGLVWDQALHDRLGRRRDVPVGVQLAYEAMSVYLATNPQGKALHDPLAACAAIDPAVVDWVEVEVTYAGGRWGAVPAEGSGTFISVAADHERFVETLVGG